MKNQWVRHIMKRGLLITGLVLVGVINFGSTRSTSADTLATSPAHAGINDAYGKLPMHFEANRGQFDDHVDFVTRGSGYSLFLTGTEAVFALHMPMETGIDTPLRGRSSAADAESTAYTSTTLRMELVGGNVQPTARAAEPLPGKVNYFIGNDPAAWVTDIPTYGAVDYVDVYPGIDLRYYGNQTELQYDFIVATGADPALIRLRFADAEAVELDANGDLRLTLPGGTLRQRAPFTYQDIDGERVEVPSRFVLLGEQAVGFVVGDYDPAHTLIIDPVLAYNTYLAGSNVDRADDIAIDSSGAAYVVGETSSPDFPTTSPYQTHQGSYDVFVTKLDPTGTTVVYSTYLGGGDRDFGHGIAVDSSGAAYIAGSTESSDFPTLNPYQTCQGQYSDIFVTKLSPAGTSLVYSTCLSGSSDDFGNAVTVDSSGHAYVTGFTRSTNFPTLNPYQTDQPDADVVVAKLAATGDSLLYSTYLGGSATDYATNIAVDSLGATYVTGFTESVDFPTVSPYQTDPGDGVRDVFVTKLDPTGSSLTYSTYLGGSGTDYGNGIAVDSSGAVFVSGYTNSTDYPTLNPYQTAQGNYDTFVTKLTPTGDSLVYSTYLGGSSDDFGNEIAVDSSGAAYVVGHTQSYDFPTTAPYHPKSGSRDVFVTRFVPTGGSLSYSVHFDPDRGLGIAVDSSFSAYVTGYTANDDAYVAKLVYPATMLASDPAVPGPLDMLAEINQPASVSLSVSNVGDAGTLLDVTLDSITPGYNVGGVPLTGITPADGAQTLDVTCTTGTSPATGTLVLATNEVHSPTYTYDLNCITVIPPVCVNPPTTDLELAGCIDHANYYAGPNTITLGADITLSAVLPTIDTEVTLEGNGFAVDGAGQFSIFEVTTTGDLTLNNVTVQNAYGAYTGSIRSDGALTVIDSTFINNVTDSKGGGIRSDGALTVINSTFNGNKANDGGAIRLDQSGTAAITSSTFIGNAAQNSGGDGGAIYNYGTLTVANSTFTGHVAYSRGGAIFSESVATLDVTSSTFADNLSYNQGGGIYNDGVATVTNSTLSVNEADRGGAIVNGSGTLTVTTSTLAGNIATEFGGGIYNQSAGTTYLAGNIFQDGGGGNCSGAVMDNGYNLSSDDTCALAAIGSLNNVTTLALLPLSSGGPGQAVHYPASSSAALGAIPNSTLIDNNGVLLACNGLTVDQLGNSRPVSGGDCTAGAVEVSTVPPTCINPVTTEQGLSDCIGFANASLGPDTITLGANITLSANLPTVDTSITLEGAGFTLDGNDTVGAFFITSSGSLAVNALTIQHVPDGMDGGIYNFGTLTVTASSFVDNAVAGIYNQGELTVTDSIFDGNSGLSGLFNQREATATISASTLANSSYGIYNRGTLTVRGSSIIGNKSIAIWNDGNLTVTTSTISNNLTSGSTAGIYNYLGEATVTATTFANNWAGYESSTYPGNSGIYNEPGTIAYLAGNIFLAGGGANCHGTIVDNGYNLSSDGSCAFTATSSQNDVTNLDLNILTSGGPGQQVNPLLSSSAAIGVLPNGTSVNNNGETLVCDGSATDQLGNSRPINPGENCAAGAVESVAPPPVCVNPVTTEQGLVGCIGFANFNPGPDLITLGADITLSAALPPISTEITLDGAGYTVDGDHKVRVFVVADIGNFTIDNVTIQNGDAGYSHGGGILNYGTLAISNSTLANNAAHNSGDGGGIYNHYGTVTITGSTITGNSSEHDGGGIFNDHATLIITNSALLDNSARIQGGGYNNEYGTVIVSNSTFSGNHGGSSGGGLYTYYGTSTLTANTFVHNTTSAYNNGGNLRAYNGIAYLSGNVFQDDGTLQGDNCDGWSIADNGYNLSSDDTCNFTGTGSQNEVTNLNLGALTGSGAGQLVHIPGNGSAAPGAIPYGVSLNNNGQTLACDGSLVDQLGVPRPINAGEFCTAGAVEVEPPPLACADPVMTEIELADCIDYANYYSGPLTINLGADIMLDGTLSPINTIITLEGAGHTIDGRMSVRLFEVTSEGSLTINYTRLQNGIDAEGGGIYNHGTLTFSHSSLVGNAVGDDFHGNGGGIYNLGTLTALDSSFIGMEPGDSAFRGGAGIINLGTLTVTNCTFSANSDQSGNAIYNQATGIATVTASTFANNDAYNGASIRNDGGTVYLAGNIFQDTRSSCNGTLIDNGYNLSWDASCGFTGPRSRNEVPNINLDPLSGSGPGQQVHLPGTGSAAPGVIPQGISISNNGVTLACNGTTTDQLGSTRPINGGDYCTAGAVEVVPPVCVSPVMTELELINCFSYANYMDGAQTITLGADITLSAAIQPIYTEITLDGAGHIIDGGGSIAPFHVMSSGDFTVNNLTIQNSANSAIRNSEGILTVTDSTFTGGSGTEGGAIRNYLGTVTVNNSLITNNSAAYGGAIYMSGGLLMVTDSTLSNNTANYGGAINIINDATVTIIGSTLAGNGASWDGGAIRHFDGTLWVHTSTFSGNSAKNGGAIHIIYDPVTVTASTFVDNSATEDASSIHVPYHSYAAYLAGNIFKTDDNNNCYGPTTDNGYNLSSDGTCGFTATGSQNNVTNLNLDALSSGGPGQQVHTPLSGSAAIGAIPNGMVIDNNGVTLACDDSTTDQLGNTRPLGNGGACTAGAVEVADPFVVTNTDDSGVGSLRQAIINANSNPGQDTISFNIPGAGPHTITPLTHLPIITDPAIIDGISQPDAHCDSWPPTLTVEITDNVLEPYQSVLSIAADNTIIRGLVINGANFAAGIELVNSSNSHIYCNFIGTNTTGTEAISAIGNGISLEQSSGNIIGTNGDGINDATERNVIAVTAYNVTIGTVSPHSDYNWIAGNLIGTDVTGTQSLNCHVGIRINDSSYNTIGTNGDGISDYLEGNVVSGHYNTGIFSLNSDHTVFAGNYIGVDQSGTQALGNGFGVPEGGSGIFISPGNYNRIGTNHDGIGDEAERNIISANAGDGIQILSDSFSPLSSGNIIAGNYIGTDNTGVNPLGNGRHGVNFYSNTESNIVGGPTGEAGNIIAFNTQSGVMVHYTPAMQNQITHNLIFDNGEFGIDLKNDGVSPNDNQDIDTGPNGLQNYPVLAYAAPSTVTGTLNSTPSTTFTLEFFSNATCDPSGYGEGERFEAMTAPTTVTTDASGNAAFSFDFAALVTAGRFITATATDPNGNTSEFSACVAVEPLPSNTNLVRNGDFPTDTAEWIIWGSTTPTVSSGVLNLTNTSYGGIFQDMGYPAPTAAPFELTVDLGNTSAADKNVQVMVHDGAFTDVLFCAFTVQAGQTLETFTVRGQTTVPWPDIRVEISPQTFDGLPALQVDNVNLQYQPGLSVSGTECVAATTGLPENTNLVRNGDFPTDTTDWIVWGSTTPAVSGGVLNLTNTSYGGIFQDMGYPAPTAAPFELTVELGNTSAASKDVQVMVHDGAFTEVLFCAFTIPASQALDTFTVRGQTTMPWPDVRVELSPQTFDGLPALLVDNVNLQYKPGLSVGGTECVAAASPLPENTNLVTNGDFPTDTTDWIVWGSTTPAVSSGVLNLTNTSFGGIFQDMGYPAPTDAPFELTVELGNTSAASKDVQVMVHDGAFTEVLFCAFTIPAGQTLETFTVRGQTTVPWPDIRVEISPQTFDGLPALLVDNVNLQYQPGLVVSGTECVAGALPENTNLVQNGDFPTDTADWIVWGSTTSTVSSGVLNLTNTSYGGLFQDMGYPAPTAAPFELTVELGNTSAASKDVQVMVHDGAFTDVLFCAFTIPAGQALDTFTVRGKTVMPWPDIRVELSPQTFDGLPTLLVDNVDLQYQPGLVVGSTECVAAAPPSVPSIEPTPADLITLEAESALVTASANWTAYSSAFASAGTYVYSSGSASDTLSFAFSGTQLDVIYVQHPALGSFDVFVDGIIVAKITSTGQQAFDQRVSITGLPAGDHQARIVPAEGSTVALDAFAVEGLASDVLPTTTPEPTAEPTTEPTAELMATPVEPTAAPVDPTLQIVESDAVDVLRTGTWATYTTAQASGGTYLYSSGSAADTLRVTISGTWFDVIYLTHPALGSFNVLVDGVVVVTVDARGAQAFDQRAQITGLAAGEHSVQIVPVAGAPIALDAFAVEALVSIEPTAIPVPTAEPTNVPVSTPTDVPLPTTTPVPVEPTQTPLPTSTPLPITTPVPLPTATPEPPPPPVQPGGGYGS